MDPMLLNNQYNFENRQILLNLAKASIKHGLKTGHPVSPDLTNLPAKLTEKRATFVTLEKNQQLRGCIGTLKAIQLLVEDVVNNAYAAAFKDPRFPALERHELEYLEVHISILSPSEPLYFSCEQDLLTQLRPNIDGLILKTDTHRATFLPIVWQSLPEPEKFLAHLKLKAGLPEKYWSDSIKIQRYTTELIG
jgi:AmmeMemoRadiSam system protein A